MKVMLQVTGRLSDAGELTLMVPGAVKAELTGVMVAALAMDETLRQRARAAKDGRDLMDFIVLYPSSELATLAVAEP
ncbi:hypothetical protein VNPA120661_37610 [Pseudomonas aeruginosa]|nr:hypothetical protein VNPA120661_37610 [Pseudomonas aeruginosa]GLE98505.1 hypothetical protein VNPA120840_53590 [Pseudomonas aeruginosa]GLF05291.1 hypothetical protein VNPA120889_54480 [Pseudomonas aeruginosa]GLF38946.1 hypothetical protein VNPA141709_16990 [Pseudomonas aeruginosa]GLF48380.1 hypothetical protein VNPA141752_50410 [Pseudomonas aeruginosa]